MSTNAATFDSALELELATGSLNRLLDWLGSSERLYGLFYGVLAYGWLFG